MMLANPTAVHALASAPGGDPSLRIVTERMKGKKVDTLEDVVGTRYLRIRYVEHLIEEGLLTSDLRWRSSITAPSRESMFSPLLREATETQRRRADNASASRPACR